MERLPDNPAGAADTTRRSLRLFKLAVVVFLAGFAAAWIGHWLQWRWLQIAAVPVAAAAVGCGWAGVFLNARAALQAEREHRDEPQGRR